MIKLTDILNEILTEKKLCPKGKAYYNRRIAAGEKPSAYLSGRAVKVCKGLMEDENQNNPQIYGELLYELLSSYNEFIGGYNENIYKICNRVENKISEDKWYSINDIISLDRKNKNIILGGILVMAFSMDAETNISNNYFAYYADRIKPSEDGIIYGFPSDKIEYYQNLLSYVGRGFFHNLSRQIDASPEEWYEILGDESFDNIAGVINTGDVNYSQSDIAKLKNNSQKYSSVSPSEMGDDLEVELASLRADKNMHESLRDWFKKEDWVRIDTQGNITGPCGTMKKGKATTRCLPRKKAQSLTKAERAATSRKKVAGSKKGKQFVKNTKVATVRLNK